MLESDPPPGLRSFWLAPDFQDLPPSIPFFATLAAQEKAAELKVRETADAARKSSAAFAIFTAVAMLIGAFIACATSAYGGTLRDEHP